jgi:hypothetical protein
MFDQEMRFKRFTTARGYANTQMGQYREDIRGLVEMTSAKMDAIYTVCTLMMCMVASFSCAGRIGMHGAAPPQYICALYTGHLFIAVLFLTLAMWLGLHATLRAQCAGVSLLTRKVRLPIPSLGQLDQARSFGSAFERQEWHDIFRCPFLPHAQTAPNQLEESSGDSEGEGQGGKANLGKKGKKGKASSSSKPKKSKTVGGDDPRTQFASSHRNSVPSWIRDEQVQDKGLGEAGGRYLKDPHDAPDHFKLFSNAQLEWYPFDVYARINMLFGVTQMVFAVTYYAIGHSICELRAYWIGWSVPIPLVAAQICILRLDIFHNEGHQLLPHLEWAGFLAPFLCNIALTLDFRYTWSEEAVIGCWIFVFLTYICHLLFALRMLDLAWPWYYLDADREESPGKAWWPASWKLPPAFSRALWVCAAPKKLEPGQHCLINEMEALSRSGGGATSCRRRKKGGKTGTKREPRPIQELKREAARLERNLDWWAGGSVFNQLSEKSQRRVHELQFEMGNLQKRLDLLGSPSKSATSNGTADHQVGDVEENSNVQKVLDSIGDGVQELDSTEKVVSLTSGTAGGEGAYTTPSPFHQVATTGSGSDMPWKLTRGSILTNGFIWIFVMLGLALEAGVGPHALLKAPGEPPWIRDQKGRLFNNKPEDIHLSTQVTPEGYRLFEPWVAGYEHKNEHEHMSEHMPILSTHRAEGSGHGSATADEGTSNAETHHEGDHAGGHEGGRRLDYDGSRSERAAVALTELLKALPALGWLANDLNESENNGDMSSAEILAKEDHHTPSDFMARLQSVIPTRWPSLFEPRHLACSPRHGTAVALTPRGFGAVISISQTTSTSVVEEARPFSLEGMIAAGPLAGASWLHDGLHLVTRAGSIWRCLGEAPNPGESWTCATSHSDALPVPPGAEVLAAAVGEVPGSAASSTRRLAGLLFKHAPDRVFIFSDDGGWHTSGEIHTPPATGLGRPSLQFNADELLILMPDSTVYQRSTSSGTSTTNAKRTLTNGGEVREWRSTCVPAHGGLLRLSLLSSTKEASNAWLPELIAST